jgi:hypothetical protein
MVVLVSLRGSGFFEDVLQDEENASDVGCDRLFVYECLGPRWLGI